MLFRRAILIGRVRPEEIKRRDYNEKASNNSCSINCVSIPQPNRTECYYIKFMRMASKSKLASEKTTNRIRPGLEVTIPPGAPRFEGQRAGNRVFGNAFVHTKYCPGRGFPYQVSGEVYNESR